MPRLPRLDAPGVLHHVVIRGIERRKIFYDTADRENFMGRLEKLVPETKTACYAWVLMPNHAHFLFRTGTTPLSVLMQKLLTGYAVSFNRRHKRHGPLFQNRYKSIICQEDAYFRELVRYIHLNPLRAKLVESTAELAQYRFCGHSTVMGREKKPWQDIDYVLSHFAGKRREALRRYAAYVEKGVDQGRRPELVGGGLVRSLGGWQAVKKLRLKGQDRIKSDSRILGDGDFVTEILSEAQDCLDRRYELQQRGVNLSSVVRKAAAIYGIAPEELHVKGRNKKRSEARSLVLYWAVRELGMTGTELARLFGLSQPGVVYGVKKGEKIAKERCLRLLD